jgi:integrase
MPFEDTQHDAGRQCAPWLHTTSNRIAPDAMFPDAAARWLASRSLESPGAARKARFLRKSTRESYSSYIDSLALFFGKLRLEQIDPGHVRGYQEARLTGAPPFVRYRRPQDAKEKHLKDGTVIPAKGKTPCPASAKKVNQELCILKMILRRAHCWTEEMDELTESLSEDHGEVPRALTPEEMARWLGVAASRSEWSVVYWYSILAFETSMSTNEIRSLRIGDVNLAHRVITVPAEGAKNSYRQRTITVDSAEAVWACERLLGRAHDLGGQSPLDYLFPFYKGAGIYDPGHPMTVSGLKKPWEEVCNACGFDGRDGHPRFRRYDTRHTAITRWAENGVPPEIIRARAGHVSLRMMLHYTHIYEGAQRAAMANLPRLGSQPEKRHAVRAEPRPPAYRSPHVPARPSVLVENHAAPSATNAFFLCGSTTAIGKGFSRGQH